MLKLGQAFPSRQRLTVFSPGCTSAKAKTSGRGIFFFPLTRDHTRQRWIRQRPPGRRKGSGRECPGQRGTFKRTPQPGTNFAKRQRQSQADAYSLSAIVRANRAAIVSARLQVERCSIRSPINGKAGDLLVSEGALIKANDVPMDNHKPRSIPSRSFVSIPQGGAWRPSAARWPGER